MRCATLLPSLSPSPPAPWLTGMLVHAPHPPTTNPLAADATYALPASGDGARAALASARLVLVGSCRNDADRVRLRALQVRACKGLFSCPEVWVDGSMCDFVVVLMGHAQMPLYCIMELVLCEVKSIASSSDVCAFRAMGTVYQREMQW
jgi:hypothetical protein